MKKSEELSRKTRKMIAKNLIVLAVLAVVAFVGVVSWFTGNPDAKASGISVKARVDDGLEFYVMPPSDEDQYDAINTRLANNATYNSNHPSETPLRTQWHNSEGTLTFNFSDQEFKFMQGLFLCEVTGDGSKFQIPKLMQFNNVAYVDTESAFEDATANDQYMSFDVYFRSEHQRDVALVEDSAFTPNTVYERNTYHNVSQPGNEKADAAIGAARMSVLNMEAQSNREVLWIPAPDVYYNGKDDSLKTGLTPSEYANKGAAYYDGAKIELRENEGTNEHQYYSFDKNADAPEDKCTRKQVTENLMVGNQLGNDVSVVTLSKTKNDGYYYGHIRVNLWIEGEDSEARLAFVGGKFLMSLHFKLI